MTTDTTTATAVAARAKPSVASRRRAAIMGRSPQDTPASRWTYLFLIITIAISAFPIYWMFVIATSTDAALAELPPAVVPSGELANNIDEVFNRENVYFAESLVNSFIVTSIVTAGVLLFCSLAGFAFGKLRFKGKNVLMIFIIATLAVPNQLAVVALYVIMGELDLNGTLPAVTLPFLVTAFGVFYMRQFVAGSVPDELIEAARVDGATTLRIYWSIVVPALRPALAVLGLLVFAAHWNEFFWPLITLGGTDNPTVQVAVADLASGNTANYRRSLTGALLATLPLLVIFFIAGKQIVRGVMEGWGKG